VKIGLRTLTPIWTGGVDMRCDRIHETGIIGSLRWWYEALVRGLGGYACDPRGGIGCPDKEGNRCPVCELFGCTGWSRKFRLRVLNNTGQPLNKPLDSNEEFIVDLIELKPLSDVEKWLINKTFWLICNYGSMGGRTVLKPQRSKRIGRDYGLVKIESLDINSESSKNEVKKRLQTLKIGNNHKDWPNLKYFFFVKNNFLWRKQMNELMGLTPKGRPQPSVLSTLI